ncbi:8497_t:CDS:1, partial [Gigaspora rosea]
LEVNVNASEREFKQTHKKLDLRLGSYKHHGSSNKTTEFKFKESKHH